MIFDLVFKIAECSLLHYKVFLYLRSRSHLMQFHSFEMRPSTCLEKDFISILYSRRETTVCKT